MGRESERIISILTKSDKEYFYVPEEEEGVVAEVLVGIHREEDRSPCLRRGCYSSPADRYLQI